ncbi:hypothetical protein [Natrinema sp. 1APR25-10V2]|uniref:hypothetical protein n=1 Tax=Natrinema sp. 1APR25-10V2 TaxID=2951081 RepID=UPI0028744B58|nr:hypothetical protein [Natrinema sp. 1APR25-10V2]MDS0475079.1 hypothetical protein [Natrinema sp. 1APR25-10V2]
MTTETVARFAVAMIALCVVVAGGWLGPTAALFSDEAAFEDNGIGAAADEGTLHVSVASSENGTVAALGNETGAGESTLEVTVENVGERPAAATYEIIIDNETVDNGTVELEPNETWSERYGIAAENTSGVEWSVVADGEVRNGTLTVSSENASAVNGTADTSTDQNATSADNSTSGNTSGTPLTGSDSDGGNSTGENESTVSTASGNESTSSGSSTGDTDTTTTVDSTGETRAETDDANAGNETASG